VREDEEEGRIVFAGHNAEVQLRLTEPLDPKTRPRTRYDGKVEQEKYYVPTGRLRATLQIDYREGPTFEDRDSRPLESQLNRVFCGIYRQVVRAWREERKHQAFRRELEEEARQRAEAARIQAEREKAIADLVSWVSAGKLKVEELQGGTITVTSTGARGGVLATPILHHPQVAILGVHEFKPRPAVRGGQIVIRNLGNLSLSLDHRVVDGAVGADFLYDLIRRLENPPGWLGEQEIE